MASPSYSSATNEIYAGRFKVPSWVLSHAAETWGVVPASNTLDDIDPENDPLINGNHPASAIWRGTGGQSKIMASWCGALYDYDTDELGMPLGGGHSDYGGNEPYKIALNAENPEWVMLRNPTGALPDEVVTDDGQEATGLYADGRLRSVHSYNKPLYVPTLGWVMGAQGNTYYSAGAGTTRLLVINKTTGELDLFGATNADASNTSGSGCCYDPSRNKVWYKGGGGGNFASYDIATNTWQQEGVYVGTGSSVGLEYIPEHDCILLVNGSLTNNFGVFDCATGTFYEPSVTGSASGMTIEGSCQPRKISSTKFAMWDNSTNTTLINTLSFASNPRTDTWSIGQLNVAVGNAVTPSVAQGNGTYGRFFYSPKLGICGVVNSTTQPIYFYKLGAI